MDQAQPLLCGALVDETERCQGRGTPRMGTEGGARTKEGQNRYFNAQ